MTEMPVIDTEVLIFLEIRIIVITDALYLHRFENISQMYF